MSDLTVYDANHKPIHIGDKVRRVGMSNGEWLQEGEEDVVNDIVNMAAYDGSEFLHESIDILVFTKKFPFITHEHAGNFGGLLEVIE